MAKTPAALVLMLHPHEHLSSPTWGSNQVKAPVKEEGANTGIKQVSSEQHPGRRSRVYPCYVQFNLLNDTPA